MILCSYWKRVSGLCAAFALGAIVFLWRSFYYCNVDEIISHRWDAQSPVVDGCGVARNDSRVSLRDPPETNWCMYDDQVDLRIIILTYNRPTSLLRLLSSVNDLETDGHSVAVEIWIDRNSRNKVDEATLKAARSFRWRFGRVGVHVHRQHVGLYGQWMATWRPREVSTAETALFLEDDLVISPFSYRWLRAARRFYADRRDLAGFTLQSEGLIRATNGGAFSPPSAATGAAFIYALVGSWGFAPVPDVWVSFQDWYAGVTAGGLQKLRPLVPGLVMSRWYRSFERKNKQKTMWTMWFVYYCSQVRGQLYTVYNNVHKVAAEILPAMSKDRYLAINRRESGLHYSGSASINTLKLLRTWRPEFAMFNSKPPVFDFSGTRIK